MADYIRNPFPKSLEERIDAVANTVNNEVKSATTLVLNEELARGKEILIRLRKIIEPDIKLTLGENLSGYCRESLLPWGIVAYGEITSANNRKICTGYKITEEGKEYLVPIAVSSLVWGVENDLSLYSILGRTSSSGKSRSPSNRLKILRQLYSQERRIADIAKDAEIEPAGVLEHLKKLSQTGLVEYESVSLHEPERSFDYALVEDKIGPPDRVKGYRVLAAQVFKAMQELKTTSSAQIAQRINYPYTSTISQILSGLTEQGFLRRTRNFKGREKYSSVRITEFGRRFVEEQLLIWENALEEGKMLQKLQTEGNSFLKDRKRASHYLSRAIENYWKVSPNGNEVPAEESKTKILNHIREHPGVRARELVKLYPSAKHHLKSLVGSEAIEKRKGEGVAVSYFIKEKILIEVN